MKRYLIGVDEVGRGPLAGPVAVGAFAVEVSGRKLPEAFFKVKDSKRMTPLQREVWTKFAKQQKRLGHCDFRVSFVGSRIIDKRGISYAIKLAVSRSLQKLSLEPANCRVLLDGGLKAPAKYLNQKTIIRGDDLEPIISAASVVAKVYRDRKMNLLGKSFPSYGFEIHKGYGTLKHRKCLALQGPCKIHRRTFLGNSYRSIFLKADKVSKISKSD